MLNIVMSHSNGSVPQGKICVNNVAEIETSQTVCEKIMNQQGEYERLWKSK